MPEDVKKFVLEKKQELMDGKLSPFMGPVKDQSGSVKIAEGTVPKEDDLEATDYLVEGVIGSIPGK